MAVEFDSYIISIEGHGKSMRFFAAGMRSSVCEVPITFIRGPSGNEFTDFVSNLH